jgi:hypothetical protein
VSAEREHDLVLSISFFCQNTGRPQLFLECHEPLHAADMTLTGDSLDCVLEHGTEVLDGVTYRS